MMRLVLLASTALLAACAAADAPPPVAMASSSAAPATPAAQNSAELAAFFQEYDRAQLAMSPLGKAFRGIVDEDYGRWGDYSDAAAIRSQKLLQDTAASLTTRFDRDRLSPRTGCPSISSRTWRGGARTRSNIARMATSSIR
jgi:hypothetical protein